MGEGRKFCAWEIKGFWVDIGRVGNYIEGNMHVIEGCHQIAPDVLVPDDATLIPPYVIGAGAKIGAKSVIGPGAVIGHRVVIGEGVHITKSVIYDEVSIGAKTRLTDCVVAGKSRLGREVCIEAFAVVGESCELGSGVQLGAHSKVGPITPVAAGTLVEGVLEPRAPKINGLQRIVLSGPIMEKLMPDEREAYATLAEYGELSAREISDLSGVPLLRVMAVLHSLEKQELVLSTQDHPRRYALTREEQIALPRRILIVADAENSREAMRLIFAAQGHSIRTACDGIEAVEAVREERFDAIIMDAEMPSLNGWDATRLLRGMPNGRNVPVVLFSQNAEKEQQNRMREVGANSIVSKKVLPEEMLSHVMPLIKK